jgi:CRISPR-associated protein Csx16
MTQSKPSIDAARSKSPRFHRVITRHPGAADWVMQQLSHQVQVVSHLAPDEIEPGGAYYGVLPLNLAAAICAQGSVCWVISVNMPPELRGQELSAKQLDELGAELVRYDVRPIDRLRTGIPTAA